MSRIGRLPITVPSQVTVDIKGSSIKVKGPKGEMAHTFPTDVKFSLEKGVLQVNREGDSPQERMIHGTARAIIIIGGLTDRADASRLLRDSISRTYAQASGLPEDRYGVSFNMRGYYGFSWYRFDHAVAPTTPAVIIGPPSKIDDMGMGSL